MRTSLQIVTPPAIEPLTLDQIKSHVRIYSDFENANLAMYAVSARTMAEAYLSRALITTGFLWTIAPEGDGHRSQHRWNLDYRERQQMELPRAPVQSVSSVVLTDINGTATTLDPSSFAIDLALAPAELRLNYKTGLIPTTYPVQHFQVGFTAGYGSLAAAVPAPIVNAILLTTAFLYEHRGDVSADLPPAAQWLLDPYRIAFFGG